MTISLPPHRQVRLLNLLETVLKQHHIEQVDIQKLLGELRSMSLALPGSKGCFSFLRNALTEKENTITITENMRLQLQDFLLITKDIVRRPTHLSEIVPKNPSYFGAVDACKLGMGGVWLPPAQRLPNSISPSTVTALRDPVLWYSHDSTRCVRLSCQS